MRNADAERRHDTPHTREQRVCVVCCAGVEREHGALVRNGRGCGGFPHERASVSERVIGVVFCFVAAPLPAVAVKKSWW